jgi:hypothetical protein
MILKVTRGYANQISAMACNWVAEPCEKANRYECEKYFYRIIKDTIACIKRGEKSYLFNEEQIAELKLQMALINTKMTFIVREIEDRYLIIPPRKIGMK